MNPRNSSELPIPHETNTGLISFRDYDSNYSELFEQLQPYVQDTKGSRAISEAVLDDVRKTISDIREKLLASSDWMTAYTHHIRFLRSMYASFRPELKCIAFIELTELKIIHLSTLSESDSRKQSLEELKEAYGIIIEMRTNSLPTFILKTKVICKIIELLTKESCTKEAAAFLSTWLDAGPDIPAGCLDILENTIRMMHLLKSHDTELETYKTLTEIAKKSSQLLNFAKEFTGNTKIKAIRDQISAISKSLYEKDSDKDEVSRKRISDSENNGPKKRAKKIIQNAAQINDDKNTSMDSDRKNQRNNENPDNLINAFGDIYKKSAFQASYVCIYKNADISRSIYYRSEICFEKIWKEIRSINKRITEVNLKDELPFFTAINQLLIKSQSSNLACIGHIGSLVFMIENLKRTSSDQEKKMLLITMRHTASDIIKTKPDSYFVSILKVDHLKLIFEIQQREGYLNETACLLEKWLSEGVDRLSAYQEMIWAGISTLDTLSRSSRPYSQPFSRSLSSALHKIKAMLVLGKDYIGETHLESMKLIIDDLPIDEIKDTLTQANVTSTNPSNNTPPPGSLFYALSECLKSRHRLLISDPKYLFDDLLMDMYQDCFTYENKKINDDDDDDDDDSFLVNVCKPTPNPAKKEQLEHLRESFSKITDWHQDWEYELNHAALLYSVDICVVDKTEGTYVVYKSDSDEDCIWLEYNHQNHQFSRNEFDQTYVTKKNLETLTIPYKEESMETRSERWAKLNKPRSAGALQFTASRYSSIVQPTSQPSLYQHPKHGSFAIQRVPGDGNCLFSAVAALAIRLGINTNAQDLRQSIAVDIRDTRSYDHFIEDGRTPHAYFQYISMDRSWGGEVELTSAAKILNLEIMVICSEQTSHTYNPNQVDSSRRIYLLYNAACNHYDALMPALQPGNDHTVVKPLQRHL